MERIIIECSDIDDAAYCCQYVAKKISEGYTNGIIEWSSDEWYIE